jgi:hypothetical protein
MNKKLPRTIATLMSALIVSHLLFFSSASWAEDGGEYYRIQLLVETDSDHTSIKPLPPWDKDWHITETRLIEPEKDQDLIKIHKLNISGGSHDDTAKEIEFTIYFKAFDEDLEFTIDKGDIGTTRVKAFNICSDKPYRIGTYTNSNAGGGNLSKYKMSIKKIAKYGTVKFTPPRKGNKRQKK